MASLFSVSSPLVIRLPTGEKRVVAECLPHPDGLLYFDLCWHLGQPEETIHLLRGTISGDGPWKVGGCVLQVPGCHGTDPELAGAFARWQAYLEQAGDDYPSRGLILAIARRSGAVAHPRAAPSIR
jgi:hypothetical protein